MTAQDIADLLNKEFYENYSVSVGNIILSTGSGSNLIALLSELIENSSRTSCKCEFRAAYVVEHLYFRDNHFKNEFCNILLDIFPKIKNESTKRHIGKVMAHALKKKDILPSILDCEMIASACVDWCIKPKVRVAVVIWAMECLFQLKDRVEWLPYIIEDMIEKLSADPTPGMAVRLRRWSQISI